MCFSSSAVCKDLQNVNEVLFCLLSSLCSDPLCSFHLYLACYAAQSSANIAILQTYILETGAHFQKRGKRHTNTDMQQ